jgi:hypothetical protein
VPIDKDLLTTALAAADRYNAADRQAEMARADYHHAVRQLHLAGAPLREIAQELGVSHQRVQQIVKSTGGTWWSRMWRGRTIPPDMTCSFCARPPGEVAKLIAGPDVYICDGCIARAEHVVHAGKPGTSNGHGMAMADPAKRVRCSFCARKGVHELKLVGDGRKHVCVKCLEQCRRILDARTQPPAAAVPVRT